MNMPLPSFYDPKQVPEVYIERAALVASEAYAYRAGQGVSPSAKDSIRIAAFGIDCQIGFCTPSASLFVPGAVEDTQRSIEWIYRHLDKLTSLHFSLDTHRVFQIFHPAFWIDEQGQNPAPLTPISTADVRSGKYRPVIKPRECLEYVQRLEAAGKYSLTIWPYHTLLGGVSHAMVPALMEAAIFHSLVRSHQTHFETKGTHAMTENYSVMSPEVRELGGQTVGAFNSAFFRLLMENDRIYVFGQAKSHCVLSTLLDLRSQIASTDPSLMQRIFVLEDAMSSVPAPPIDPLPAFLDFPRIAEEAFADLRASGMNIVRTTDPITI